MVAGLSLDQRVGDYDMTGDGGRGAHGGSHGARGGHKGFHEMSPTDFLKKARVIHDEEEQDYIKDNKKRAEEAENIHREYNKHLSRLEHELGEQIDKKFDYKKVEGIHNKIQEAYAHVVHGSEGGKKGLNKRQREKHLKDLLETIMPDLGYNLPDKDALFNFFIKGIKDLQENKQYGQRAGAMYSELEEALKTGDGYSAAEQVKELMKLQTSAQYHAQFQTTLVNPEDKEFLEAYSGRIVEQVKSRTGRELSEPMIRANILEVLGDYVHDRYAPIIKEHGKTKEPKHGHGAAHH